MKYTTDHTCNEILADENIRKCLGAFFSVTLFDLLPEEYWDRPVRVTEAEVMMPWGMPFPAWELVDAANRAYETVKHHSYHFIGLYQEYDQYDIPDLSLNNESSVSLMISEEFVNGRTGEKRPAAIICPGGGYRTLAGDSEGVQYAKVLAEAGYVPFILYYRLNPNLYPAPQNDLTRAIEYVRAHADRYGADASDILCVGSSAGGHLCASTAMLNHGTSGCPDKLCLCYPVISLTKEAHEDSGLALTDNDPKLLEMLSVDKYITPDFPQTFLWTCLDDSLVPPSNTLRMAEALEAAGVEHLCRVYKTGEHGCGLAAGTSAEGWIYEMIDYMSGK